VRVSPNEYGQSILVGKMRVRDLDPQMSTYYLFWIEDYAVQVGQGKIADRANEHLGRMDAGVILLRKIWQRELDKLAQGSPLKQWTTPAGLNE
jgi:5,5'-dehydrodivanillate O-demethylase oxygenase subunit